MSISIITEIYKDDELITPEFFRDKRELFEGYPTAKEIEIAIDKAKNMNVSKKYTIYIDEQGIKIKTF